MNLPHVLYLHGFRSSSASRKARVLRQHAAALGLADHLTIPDLSPDPTVAMAAITAFVATKGTASLTLVGSSLGGFYATVMVERHPTLQAVLINPPVNPHTHLASHIGPQTIFGSEGQFEFRAEHVAALAALNPPTLRHAHRFWLLAEMADTTCAAAAARDFYRGARQTIFEGGSHDMDHFAELVPALLAFAGFKP
jgi:uncharacterized protein